MLILSTTMVLLLYIFWLFSIYSIIPSKGNHGLVAIYHSKNQLIAFNNSLNFYLKSNFSANILRLFQLVALLGSSLCVSLSLFDFLLDMIKNQRKCLIAIFTFCPPLLLTFLSENIYLYATSISGYIAIMLEIIIPSMAKFKNIARKSKKIYMDEFLNHE
jgi:amino acid permease